MSVLTVAIYNKLINDSGVVSLVANYNGSPAVFTSDPPPGDAQLPYIVSAGNVSQSPVDTKTTIGIETIRDIRCYDADTGSPVVVEALSERVREIFHRSELTVSNWRWVLSVVTGPTVADELDAYGRIITLRARLQNV